MSENANGYTPKYLTMYQDQIREALKTDLGLDNIMQVPRLKKIVLNMGIGEATRDEKILVSAEGDMAMISGQKPRRTLSKKSVAAFKIRDNMPLGCMVTLRGPRMYEFLERLINVAIPRIRDFRGLPPKGFDGRGNYNFGIREHTIFTEVDTSQGLPNTLGMNLTFVTSAETNEQSYQLLKKFGMPFREI